MTAMISTLDVASSIATVAALAVFLVRGRYQLAYAERVIILLICGFMATMYGSNAQFWFGESVGSRVGEHWNDYLQFLQPALWGAFFYVVVQNTRYRQLEASQQRMRGLVENMPVVLHAYDRNGRILAWNHAAEEVSGYSREEVCSDAHAMERIFVHPGTRAQVLLECREGGGDYHHRIHTLTGKYGERQVAWYNIAKHFPLAGWANWRVGLDMTEQIAVQEQLEHLATHDALTGLPNRALFQDRLQHALAACQRRKIPGALLMLDLDHYKMVNDTHGHPVGDQLLCAVSERLGRNLKATDTLARFGGDEFVILLEEVSSPEKAAMVAERLLHALAVTPFDLVGHDIRTYASIGVALFPDDDVRADELMKCVDMALYNAKQNGRNTYRFFTSSLNGQFRRQLAVNEKLGRAIKEDQLELHYQPQASVAEKRVVGVEALLRWPDFEGEALPPDVFIPIAESMGMMPALGRWVLDKAFCQAARWRAEGLSHNVSINLSAVQLYQPDIGDVIMGLTSDWGLDPTWIDFEITESAVMSDVETAIATLRRLRDRGFHISLDDFGTGYSSLSYLKNFPVSCIKIDKSFVQSMENSAGDAAIVRSVLHLGHELGLQVVAEGVETEQQWQTLEREGCDIIQGYYFARPMPVVDVEHFLREGGQSFWSS